MSKQRQPQSEVPHPPASREYDSSVPAILKAFAWAVTTLVAFILALQYIFGLRVF